MPQIYELFGYPLSDRTAAAESGRKACECPFTGSICDGGGNRYQTTIDLSKDINLATYFNPGISKVVPGVCSIQSNSGTWIVCPRRLLGFKRQDTQTVLINQHLQSHEERLLRAAGISAGAPIGVWSEVTLKLAETVAPTDSSDTKLLKEDLEEEAGAGEDSSTNYHFDYVTAEVENLELSKVVSKYRGDATDLKRLVTAARSSGLVSGRKAESQIISVPDLTRPFFIFEVMTASTSGSNTAKQTDIRSAFRNAILGRAHEAPGINKRQVWARMVSQLFSKSALAEQWGGKTVWVVQNELLRYMELTTRLTSSSIPSTGNQDINLISMYYDLNRNSVHFQGLRQGDAGIPFKKPSNTYADILLPKRVPPVIRLVEAMLRRPLAGMVRL